MFSVLFPAQQAAARSKSILVLDQAAFHSPKAPSRLIKRSGRSSYETVIKWISAIWEDFPADQIRQSFRSCGIVGGQSQLHQPLAHMIANQRVPGSFVVDDEGDNTLGDDDDDEDDDDEIDDAIDGESEDDENDDDDDADGDDDDADDKDNDGDDDDDAEDNDEEVVQPNDEDGGNDEELSGRLQAFNIRAPCVYNTI